MFFTRQRREIAELAVRARADRRRVDRARVRLLDARQRFLGNPVNLLLPFTAGALGGALALYRKPTKKRADGSRERAADGVSLRSLISTAGMLWSATATLREGLREARFEPPSGPPSESLSGSAPSDAGMPPPSAVSEVDESGEPKPDDPAPARSGSRHALGQASPADERRTVPMRSS